MQEITSTPTATLADVPVASCPQCHQPVREQDFFCSNCGKNLKPAPPSTTIGKQLMLYIGSFLLPPIGIIWAIPYLRYPNSKSKMVGIVILVITGVSLIASIMALQGFYGYVQDQVDQATQQLDRMQGF